MTSEYLATRHDDTDDSVGYYDGKIRECQYNGRTHYLVLSELDDPPRGVDMTDEDFVAAVRAMYVDDGFDEAAFARRTGLVWRRLPFKVRD